MTKIGPWRRWAVVALMSVLVVVAFGAGVLVGTISSDGNSAQSDEEATSPDEDRPPQDDSDAVSDAIADGAGAEVIPKAPLIECPLFPENNYWYADVSDLAVHPDSDTFIDSIGADVSLHPDFGTVYEGEPIGIPYTVTSDDTEAVEVTFDYDDESDPGPYLIPQAAPIEGGPDSDGDRHVLVVDNDTCTLYELFYAFPQSDGVWTAGSGAIFDLTSNELRPAEFTSADAAGLPILPGLIHYDEVAAGDLEHAMRFTLQATQNTFVWPARHQAGDENDSLPPMGAWLRLRSDIDLSVFSAEVQVILAAMQRHGMILADNGGSMFVSGVPDERWDDEVLAELDEVTASDFEVIDATSLMVDPDSGEVESVEGTESVGGAVGAGELPGGLPDLGDESGDITYALADGGLFRVEAREGTEAENLSDALDALSPGQGDEWVDVSPDGRWLLVSSERFGCEGWACLAVIDAELTNAETVEVGDEPLRVAAFSALGPGGDLIVYASEDGPHETDLWATSREDGDWGTPVLLSGESDHAFHDSPRVSDDGDHVVFDCGPEPYGAAGTGICRVSADGSELTTLVSPEDGPDGSTDNALHSADFEADGSIVFEADWQGGEALWRVDSEGENPRLISNAFANDNSPCVLPSGRLASLWLDRADAEGFHEMKVMEPDGGGYFMLVVDIDVADIGLGCAP